VKCDEIIWNVIGLNIPALEAVQHMVYSRHGSSDKYTHHHIVDSNADATQVCAELVEEEVSTFNAERGSSAAESVSYSPDLCCQGLEIISNVASLREDKFKARGYWTNGTVVD